MKFFEYIARKDIFRHGKRGVFVALFSFLLSVPSTVLALGDLHYSADATFTVGTFTVTVENGSDATTLIVNDNATLTVTVPQNDTFKINVAEGNTFTVSPSVEPSCGNPTRLTLAGPGTFTVTPVTRACTVATTIVVPVAPAPTPQPAKKEEATPAKKDEAKPAGVPAKKDEKKPEQKQFVFKKIEEESEKPAKKSAAPIKKEEARGAPAPAAAPAPRVEIDLKPSQQTVEKAEEQAAKVVEAAKSLSKQELKEAVKDLDVRTQNVVRAVKNVTNEVKVAIENFIEEGTEETENLGAGARAGCLQSYKSTYRKLPDNESEWEDVIRICTGTVPAERRTGVERYHEQVTFGSFIRGVRFNKKDKQHQTFALIATYGLRPSAEERSLTLERDAQKVFRKYAHRSPKGSDDLDVVRAIAYSGLVYRDDGKLR